MPYSKNFTAKINPNASFFRNCVAHRRTSPQQTATSTQKTFPPIHAMPPPPPPPPPPPFQPPSSPNYPTPGQRSYAESVLGVMLLRKPKSLGRYDTYTGVVTTQRMIFAQMTNEMLKNAIQIARDQAKAEGKGFWGQWEDQLKVSFGYTRRYLTMDPNAALAETLGNFAVNNDTIREVKLNLKNIQQAHGDAALHEFELEIASSQGKFEFRTDERDEYVKLMKQVYGERVKMPFGYFSSHGFKIKL